MDSPTTSHSLEQPPGLSGSTATSNSKQARPLHSSPVRLSSFPPQRVWGPRCSHSSMSTFYQESFHCEVCKKWNSFGWLYRCVVDRDPLIMEGKNRGLQVTFDQLGQQFAEEMTLGKFGPDVRFKKNSFLSEISMEQMSSYTPQQLATILLQRDDVIEKITEERNSEATNFNQAKSKFPDDEKPWLTSHTHECQYKVCHRCHGMGRDKSWVSLNAVLNGDVLPHLATGFSFSHIGTRPVTNAEVVKSLGCRPVPLPRQHQARIQPPPGFEFDAAFTAADVIDEHLRLDNEMSDESGAASALDEYIMAPELPFPSDLSHIPGHIRACYTPLPEVDSEEQISLAEPRTVMEEIEEEEGVFGSEPLEVIEGIALTEEGVESSTADIMTHSVPNSPLSSPPASS